MVRDFAEVPRDAERVIFFPPRRGRRRRRDRDRARRACRGAFGPAPARLRAAAAAPRSAPAYDPGRERRAERKARELLRSVVGARGVRDVPSSSASSACSAARGDGEGGYGYLIYPHRPIVAYDTATGELLSEYCVSFPDRSEPAVGARLPDADDVLAKWMALRGDERGLIADANMHLARPPGRPRRRCAATCAGCASGSGATERSARRELTAPSARGRARAAVFDGPDRAAARAYMKGIGFDDDGAQPSRRSGSPTPGSRRCPATSTCAASPSTIKEGVRAAGGTPMEFNTIAISDGITMGTKGMKTSLVSREVIADSIELTARGYQFDAVVALSACDKTIPGCVMALARLDIPSVMLYGGSIAPGRWHGKDVTILDVFEAIGAHAAGEMSDEELRELEDVASPGAGACGGQFTANTMACAFEALGISPGGSAMVPAEDDDKEHRRRADRRAGDAGARARTCARAR